MTPSPLLLDALDAAYDAFSGYPRPQQMDAAPARDAVKIMATLSSASLRELSGEQIGPYAGWALTTVGSVKDYKHFLPRILEQAVCAPEWMGTMPPVIASRLKLAKWRAWPKSESAAVTEVFVASLRDAIDKHPEDGAEASSWLCALAALEEDIRPLLRDWLHAAEGNALLQIANLATELPALMSLGEQTFWADLGPEVRTEIVGWLTSAQVGAALAKAAGVAASDMGYIEQALNALATFAASTRR